MPRDRSPKGGSPSPRPGGRPGGKFGGSAPARGGRFSSPEEAPAPRKPKPPVGHDWVDSEGLLENKPKRRGVGGSENRGRKPAAPRGAAPGGEARPGRGAAGEARAERGAAPRGGGRGGDERPRRSPAQAEGRPPRSKGPAGEGRGRGPRTEERPSRPVRERAERPIRERAERPARDRDERPIRAHGEDFAEEQRNDIVFGRHPALAALEGTAAVNKVWLLNGLRNAELVAKVRELAKAKGATVQMVERPKLDDLTFEGNHQGIVVSLAMASYVELEDAIAAAKAKPHPALLVLDGIEDPHNLGALVRTAEGAEFAAVVIASRRAVGLTPTVAKAAAGALQRVPVARVTNLVNAAKALKDAGFWLVGADAEGEKLPYEVDLTQPLALVIGGEGKGLSRLLAETCDWRVRLPLGGELESLNASVAGGVLMYEAVRQRWGAQS